MGTLCGYTGVPRSWSAPFAGGSWGLLIFSGLIQGLVVGEVAGLPYAVPLPAPLLCCVLLLRRGGSTNSSSKILPTGRSTVTERVGRFSRLSQFQPCGGHLLPDCEVGRRFLHRCGGPLHRENGFILGHLPVQGSDALEETLLTALPMGRTSGPVQGFP